MDNNLKVYCDGGSRGNPGPAASAFVVFINGKEIKREYKYINIATNNVAEYTALYMALSWINININVLKKENILKPEIYLDSELVAKQVRGEYKIKNKNLFEIYKKIKLLEEKINLIFIFKNIPREKNKIADGLVNVCLDNENSRVARK